MKFDKETIREQLAICETSGTPALCVATLVDDGWREGVAIRIAAAYKGYPEALLEIVRLREELDAIQDAALWSECGCEFACRMRTSKVSP